MASRSAFTWPAGTAFSTTSSTNFVRPRHFAKAFQGILQQFFWADPLDIEPLLARFDPGQGQQIFRQASHAGRVLADDFHKLPDVIVCERAVEQRLGVSLIEVSGVRSSWETLAMKSRRLFSMRSVSVRSRNTATAPPRAWARP